MSRSSITKGLLGWAVAIRLEYGERYTMSTEAEKRIRDLTKDLNKWADAYHQEDDPVVPDSVYDAAIKELRELETKYPQFQLPESPIHRVGAQARSQFVKVRHNIPMLSLANVF